MVKLAATLAKKMPIPGCDYSSQQYGASLEIEVSDADRPEAIQARIRELYSLLSSAIDEQIGVRPTTANVRTLPPPVQVQQQVMQPLPPPPQRNDYTNGNGRNRVAAATANGNARRVTCTEAQAKCIYAICKAQNLDLTSVLADFNVSEARDLHVRDASRLIDQLKAQQNGAAS